MRALSEALLEQHYSESKEPHYVVELAFDDAATDLVYFTSHSNTDLPVSAVSIPASIKKISSTSQKITPDQGRSTIGAISVELVDIDGAITTLFKAKDIAGIGLRQRRVRAFIAYEGMAWADTEANIIQTQIVESLEQEANYFNLKCADIQRITRKKIFEPVKTRLSQTIDSTQLIIPVLSITDSFTVQHGSSYTDAPSQSVGYIKIEDEVVRWTSTITDPDLGLSFVADKRGALNTLPAIHEVSVNDTNDRGQEVTEFIYLEMPAVKLAYALLTGILLGQDGETLPLNWHLGVAPSFVRVADFNNIGVDLWDTSNDTGFVVRFAGEKAQDGKKFIETQINLLLGCFMPIYSGGAFGCKRFSNVLYESPYVFELNEDNIVSHGNLKVDMRGVRNLLSVQWNYDFIRDKLTRQKILVDEVSREKWKGAPSTELTFRGLHGSRHTAAAIEGLFDRLRDRYAGPPLTISVKGLPLTNMLEVGDIVKLRLSGVNDYQLGGSINRSMEVESVSVDWLDGTVSFELLGSSNGATLIGHTSGGLGTVLPDSWYTSAGTDLATYPGITLTESGGVGHITAGTIVGGDTLAQGRFFYNGDLEVDAGAEIFIENNVSLAIKGFFQVNGTINGVGTGVQALPAIVLDNTAPIISVDSYGDPADEFDQHAAGVSGYLGPTISAGGVRNLQSSPGSSSFPGFITNGLHETVPALNITYRDGDLIGAPEILWGSSGAQGRAYQNRFFPSFLFDHAGGAGGAGGAGLMTISRGFAFGAAGLIDLSGADGLKAIPYAPITGPQNQSSGQQLDVHYPGSGAGGATGAVIFLLDGLTSTIPDLTSVTCRFGKSPFPVKVNDFFVNPTLNYVLIPGQLQSPFVAPGGFQTYYDNDQGERELYKPYSYYWGYGESPPDLSGFNGAARVQFIPPNLTTIEDEPSIFEGFYELPVLNNLQLSSGTETLLAAVDGSIQERIKASWNVITDNFADGYELQARALGDAWRTVAVIVDVDAALAFINVTEGVAYQVRVRAYSNRVTARPSPWLRAADHLAQGKSVAPNDATGFAVTIQSDTGAKFVVDSHPDIDFKRFLFYQGSVFSSAVFLFDSANVQSLSGVIASADDLTFWVVVEDRTGNLSSEVSAIAVVNNPNAIMPALSYEGVEALVQWPIPASTFSIDYYEVSMNNVVISESKSTNFKTKVTWLGANVISIIAVDIAGNRGNQIDVNVNPSLPAAPILTALKTAANQFKLVYSAMAGNLPIDAYIVSVGGLSAPTEVLEKAGASTFTTISEDAGGDYDYFVQARDSAGNIGAAAAITVRLEDSTDLSLILTDSQASSSFTGTRTNIIEADDDLILPVPDGRLWQDKYSSYATIQTKIDAGFPEFLQPAAASATYVYTVDAGAVIAQATAQVLVSLEQLVGTVTAAVSLEQSDDDVTYTSVSTVNGAGQAVSFRYIRATIAFTPTATTDLAKLLEINTSILTIAREESGTFTSTATAGGDTVALDQPFADIQSIIATANNFDQIDAAFDWIDPNPTEFKAQIFDKGTTNRYLGEVGYTVKGI